MKETSFCDTFFVGLMTEDESCAHGTRTSVDMVEQAKWTEALHANGAVITFKLDTGTKANLVNV